MNRITCARRTPTRRELEEHYVKRSEEARSAQDFMEQVLNTPEPVTDNSSVKFWETEDFWVSSSPPLGYVQVCIGDSTQAPVLDPQTTFQLIGCLLRGLSAIGEYRGES